jgi:hypothetical protein
MLSPELAEVVAEISSWQVFDLFSFNLHTNSTYLGYTNAHPVNRDIHVHVPSLLEQARSSCDVPILFTGGISHPSKAEWFLETSGVDLVGMTRACIADPEAIAKASNFSTDQIRPCIGCNQGCVGNTWEGRPLSCTVNPDVGYNEGNDKNTRRKKSNSGAAKRIAIVGAGPAGLEAALEATKLDCNVVLYESGPRVGGKLLFAGRLPQKENYLKLVEFYEDQILRSSAVELHLNSQPSGAGLAEFEVVLDARGSVSVKGRNPFKRRHTLDAVGAASKPKSYWKDRRVLLIDEDWVQDPLAIALQILFAGGVVTHIISTREYVGLGLDVVNLTQRLREIRNHAVGAKTAMLSFTKLEGIDDDGRVLLNDLCTSRSSPIRGVDTIVSVQSDARRSGNADLLQNPSSTQVISIGDAAGPRGVEYALRDARNVVTKFKSEEHNEN